MHLSTWLIILFRNTEPRQTHSKVCSCMSHEASATPMNDWASLQCWIFWWFIWIIEFVQDTEPSRPNSAPHEHNRDMESAGNDGGGYVIFSLATGIGRLFFSLYHIDPDRQLVILCRESRRSQWSYACLPRSELWWLSFSPNPAAQQQQVCTLAWITQWWWGIVLSWSSSCCTRRKRECNALYIAYITGGPG